LRCKWTTTEKHKKQLYIDYRWRRIYSTFLLRNWFSRDLISGFDFVLFYYYFFPIFSFFFSIEISIATYGDTRKKNICQAFMYTPPSTKVLVYQLKTKEKCVCMCERASARARPLTCNLWLKEDNCKKDRKYQNLQKKKKQLLTWLASQ
jgi:hypothetical protein